MFNIGTYLENRRIKKLGAFIQQRSQLNLRCASLMSELDGRVASPKFDSAFFDRMFGELDVLKQDIKHVSSNIVHFADKLGDEHAVVVENRKEIGEARAERQVIKAWLELNAKLVQVRRIHALIAEPHRTPVFVSGGCGSELASSTAGYYYSWRHGGRD